MSNETNSGEAAKAELMARYGIIQSTAEQFRYKRYLYSRFGDALAQARRDNPSS